MTHICVGKWTIISSDNGVSPGRRQAIISTNAGILLTEPLGTHFSEILIGIQILSFKKMRLKMSSAKWRPLCLGLNVLRHSMICSHQIPHNRHRQRLAWQGMSSGRSSLWRILCPGARFTNGFSIAIQIRWKYRFTLYVPVIKLCPVDMIAKGIANSPITWHEFVYHVLSWRKIMTGMKYNSATYHEINPARLKLCCNPKNLV